MSTPGGSNAGASTTVDETGLLASTYVFCLTWGVCAMQLASYWNKRSKDHPILQGTVFALFINETIWTIMRCWAAHRQILILVPGSKEARGMPRIQIISCYLANITLMGVNLFLIYRYYRLTKRWWLAVPLAILACISLSFHFWANTVGLKAVDIVMAPKIDVVALGKTIADCLKSNRIASIAEFTIVAATNVLLLIELISYSRRDLLSGKQILRRLILMTVESGVVTFALTGTMAVLSWFRPATSTMSILMACCARAYYHTMLFNLNMRTSSSSVMRDSEQPGLSHLSGALRTRDGDHNGTLQGTQLQSVSVSYHTHNATKEDLEDKSNPFAGSARGV